MTDTINWGILATGVIAGVFTEDLKLLPDARVTAVASRSVERARGFAERFDIPTVHGDWYDLAADDSVDVVYVANTHDGHYEAVKRCLEGGKAVLCEKPFTVNLAQATELIDLARSRNLFLMEAMWTRCNPAIRRMTAELAEGTIGRVRMFNADFGIVGPTDPSHRLNDPAKAGGALLDLGVYPVSLANLVLGKPTTVAAIATRSDLGVDDTTGVLLGYADGAIASLSCSKVSSSPVSATISGTEGRIEFDGTFVKPSGYRVQPADFVAPPRVVEVAHHGHGYTHQAVEVMRCLREGLVESPLMTWQDTLDVMGTLDEIRDRIDLTYPGE